MNPENLIVVFFCLYFGLQILLRGYVYLTKPDQSLKFEQKLAGNVWWPFPLFTTEYNPKYHLITQGCGLYFLLFGLFWIIFGLLVAFNIIKLMSK